MANLKRITELPVAESAENVNLIIEDAGSAKKIPAHKVGAQADWDEEDTTSPAYILNKPNISSGGGGAVYVYNASGHPSVNIMEIEFDSSLSAQENSDLFYERVSSGLVILKWEGGIITPVLGYDARGGSVSIAIYYPGSYGYIDSNLLPPSTI